MTSGSSEGYALPVSLILINNNICGKDKHDKVGTESLLICKYIRGLKLFQNFTSVVHFGPSSSFVVFVCCQCPRLFTFTKIYTILKLLGALEPNLTTIIYCVYT